MKNTFFSVVIIVVMTLLIGCSNNLSRNTAENLIKEKYNFPEIQTEQIGGLIVRQYYGGESKQRIDDLLAKGLISVKETQEIFDPGGLMECYRVSLTDEGNKYLVSQNNEKNSFTVKTSEIIFGEITGIVERKEFNNAEATYTTKRTNITPFGSVFNINEEVYNHTESFTKYDNGWRIEQ